MKQRYTFLALLTDVSKNIQPDVVIYRNKEFKWNPAEKTYKDEKGKDLMGSMSNYGMETLTLKENITAEVQILNEQEHTYLKMALAPIRKQIIWIKKALTSNDCAFLDICYNEIPEYGDKDPNHVEGWAFKRGDAFLGMKPGWMYNPEDLDL